MTGRVKTALGAVEAFLKATGPQPGSVIAAFLDTTEDFHAKEHGFPSLTSFMQAIPDVRIVSYRGTDRVWQLANFAGRTTPTTDAGAEVWRALASPNSWHRVAVFVHSGTGEWQVLPRSEALELVRRQSEQLELSHEGWRRVPPMPPETHHRIARSFAKRSDLGELGQLLLATLKVQNVPWWEMWRELLSPTPELFQSWFDTRDRELRRFIRNTIRGLGLTEDVLEQAVSVPGPPSHDLQQRGAVLSATTSRNDGTATNHANTERVQQAIHAAVDQMTVVELHAFEIVIAALRRALTQ